MNEMSHQAPCVAVVAPSGFAPELASVERALTHLRARGCRVHCLYQDAERFQRFGAGDDQRAAQLHAAAGDPEVDIVLALRGGYGLSRLLPALDLDALAASGKLFVGHSDFTALHMALLTRGGVSFAGPMLCADFSRSDPSTHTLDDFWRCLRGPVHALRFRSAAHAPLDVAGPVWGGNLTMLAHLVGTPYLPHIEGGILFLEDVNEHPYRIERMLLQLHYAGLLNQRAIVFGDFSGYRLGEYDNGYDFEAMLDFLRARIGVPLLTGLPFGHIRDKSTLVVGSQGRLVTDGMNCTLEMRAYPTLG
jgi:muramoyltetrapeptide carboxypeptidase